MLSDATRSLVEILLLSAEDRDIDGRLIEVWAVNRRQAQRSLATLRYGDSER
jgi:hypothetical protein